MIVYIPLKKFETLSSIAKAAKMEKITTADSAASRRNGMRTLVFP